MVGFYELKLFPIKDISVLRSVWHKLCGSFIVLAK